MPLLTNHRYQELDALRGVCVLAVLASHYTTVYAMCYAPTEQPAFLFPWIAYRVQIFCMISGFVITMISEKEKNLLHFFVARFSRLYPAYAFTVALSAVLVTAFALPFKGVTLGQVLVNLTMLQSWFGVKNIEGSFWYLTPELSFYAVMALVLLFRKMKYIERIGLAVLLLLMLGFNQMPDVLVNSKLLFTWHLFYAGIIFYGLKTKGDAWHRHAGLALCFVVQNLISDDFSSVLCLAGVFVIFYLFVYGKLGWLIQKPLLFLGTISYSLFLIHENMGWIIIRGLEVAGANAWLRFVIPTAVAILVAWLMTIFIERPAMKYLRNKLG